MEKSRMKNLAFAITLAFTLLFVSSCTENVDKDSFEYVIQDGYAVITEYTGNCSSVLVPASIDGYPVYALEGTFYGNTVLEKVKIENGIEMIGMDTFAGCSNLQSVKIPVSVRELGSSAFANSGIKEITLPENLTYVGFACFQGCSSLKFMKTEADVVTFEDFALYDSGIELIQVKNAPVYFNYTFSEDCLLSYGSLESFSLRTKPLNTLAYFIRPLPIFLKAVFLMAMLSAVIAIIILLIAFCRFIAKKSGRDKATIYRQYSSAYSKSIYKDNPSLTTVIYHKPKFKRDSFKWLLLVLYLYLYSIGFWFVSDEIITVRNPTLQILMLLLIHIGFFAALFCVIWLVYKEKNNYYQKKGRLPYSSIRIRRFRRRN